jgi:hypothetical protein
VWKLQFKKDRLSRSSQGQGHPEKGDPKCYRCSGESSKEAKRTIPYGVGLRCGANEAVSHQDTEVLQVILEATIVTGRRGKQVLWEAAGVMSMKEANAM